MPGREADLALLEGCSRRAGEIALRYFCGSYRCWSKEGGSPVTEADLAIDAFLKSELLRARPGYGWLSEETADNPTRLERFSVFIVDPIDGTAAFMKGRPHFSISAAVVEHGRPVAGVVFNPATGECFTACSGGGAHLNGVPIRASVRSEVTNARLLGNKKLFAAWSFAEVANVSSIAYRVALVAAARYDAMVSLTMKRDWDLAAADIIISEAGGRLVSAGGGELGYNSPETVQGATIAACGPLIAPLLAELKAKNLLKADADSF
ncbi:MAG: 3'(2'),5'-bisphosphate nucleotidase CysQ [Rhizomicrobium sp.]